MKKKNSIKLSITLIATILSSLSFFSAYSLFISAPNDLEMNINIDSSKRTIYLGVSGFYLNYDPDTYIYCYNSTTNENNIAFPGEKIFVSTRVDSNYTAIYSYVFDTEKYDYFIVSRYEKDTNKKWNQTSDIPFNIDTDIYDVMSFIL